jgi:hypothetical protein
MMSNSKPEAQTNLPNEDADSTPRRRPFDISAIEKLPFPDENDPPYRPFWVTEQNE